MLGLVAIGFGVNGGGNGDNSTARSGVATHLQVSCLQRGIPSDGDTAFLHGEPRSGNLLSLHGIDSDRGQAGGCDKGDGRDVLTPTPVPTSAEVLSVLEPTQVLAALAPQTGVEAVIRSYGWDDETALAVFKCENGYNTYGYWRPDAVSVTGDYGIVQLNAARTNP